MTNAKPSAAIVTLGCKVNQYESEAIAERLTEHGFLICRSNEKCDVYIINTCTVTQESERKCRQMIRRARNLNKEAYILVCGCLSQTDPESISAIEGVDYICGNTKKMSVADMAIKLVASGRKNEFADIRVEDIFSSPFEEMRICRFDRTRAYVKIEDGCENRCTYCIIPSARGKVRSKPMKDALEEISQLTRSGCREVVLTGIETGSYGKDTGEYDLADLLLEIDKLEGIQRVRTGSLDPSIMKPDFIKRLSAVRSLSPHFHLSMQSGSDRILALMKRKYNTTMALRAIEGLRKAIPDVMFTTDIITGFPGETEEDFNETKSFLEKVRFLDVHVFPYSEREGTPASTMDGKVPVETRHKRCGELIALQKDISRSVTDEYVSNHSTISVLFETYSGGVAYGHTPSFIEIAVKSERPLHSEIHTVRPTEKNGDTWFAEIVLPEEV